MHACISLIRLLWGADNVNDTTLKFIYGHLNLFFSSIVDSQILCIIFTVQHLS